VGRYAAVAQLVGAITNRIVLPHRRTVSGIEGADVDPLVGKYSGAAVDHTPVYQHARADRPEGDHPPVAKDFLVARTRPLPPDQRSIDRTEAIDIAVVRPGVDTALVNGRGETDRAFGEAAPADRPRSDINRAEFIRHGGPEERATIGQRHVKGAVRVHARHLLRRSGPCRFGTMRRGVRPLKREIGWQTLGAHSAASGIAPVCRPVGRSGHASHTMRECTAKGCCSKTQEICPESKPDDWKLSAHVVCLPCRG